jgi:hypothetical protein
MNKAVEILMQRNSMTQEEAEDLLIQTRQELDDCNYDIEEAEDIIASNLGLEMDYILDIL